MNTCFLRKYSPDILSAPYFTVCRPIGLPISAHLIYSTTILGIAVALFFRCMNALLNPVTSKKRAIKWVFVFHTTAMFSIVTALTAIKAYILFSNYSGYLKFRPLLGNTTGPIRYLRIDEDSAAFNILFTLNQWLADGLLVSSISESFTQLSNTNCSSSFTVTVLFMP